MNRGVSSTQAKAASETLSRQTAMLLLLLGFALAAGLIAAWVDRAAVERSRLDMMQIDARRKSVEIMAATLNGNLMGAITLMGLTNRGLPGEARSKAFAPNENISDDLREVGLAFGANGVFVVGQDGVVKSSWDARGKVSTGLVVGFRPYFKTAMSGKTNVYPALSLSQGQRVLYFAAPIVDPVTRVPVGAIVARTDLARVDAQLLGDFDRALLLSPQELVFASSQPEWIGNLAAAPTAERLGAIRAQRQFGDSFDRRAPKPLPFTLTPGLNTDGQHHFAVVSAEVNWNDPAGFWTVVLMQDLNAAVPATRLLTVAGLAAALTLLLGWMGYRLRRGRLRQQRATAQLHRFAQEQEATATFRTELSRLAVQLQRCEQLPELASAFLAAAREMLAAMQGAVYVASLGEPMRLRLIGTAAAGAPVPDTLALGEGLLGQCAQDRRLMVLPTPVGGPWTLRSGLGNSAPAALVLAPLVLREQLVGVVELAMLHRPDEQRQARLEEMLSLLSNSLEILRRRESVGPSLTEERKKSMGVSA